MKPGRVLQIRGIPFDDMRGFYSACVTEGTTMTEAIRKMAAKVAAGDVALLRKVIS
jgi:hypothetical protein